MKTPKRIVSLVSNATEMLFALGVGDRVVGVSHDCDYPPSVNRLPAITGAHVDSSQASSSIDRQVRQAVAESAPLYSVNADRLEQLAPELIVTQAQCDVCAVRYDDVLDIVRRSPRLKSTRVLALDPRTTADILNDITRVGAAAGVARRAAMLIGSLRRRIDAVRTATTALSEQDRRRVAIIEWIDPLMLAGNWTPELLHIAGGQCSLTTAGQPSQYTDWDELIELDPEVVIVAPCGFDLPRTIDEASSLAERPGWPETTASRAGRVFALDGNAYLNRSGPRIVESVEILAHLIDHDRFPAPLDERSRETAWRRLTSGG